MYKKLVAISIKYCYVLHINLFLIPDSLFLLHAILETALTHLRGTSYVYVIIRVKYTM